MTAEQIMTVQITQDGMLPIPEELGRELGLTSAQTVQLARREDSLVVRAFSQQEIGDRIVALLKEASAGLSWEEVKAERANDAFWR